MGGAPKITIKEGEWVNICAFVYESVPMFVVLLIQDWLASATLHNTCVAPCINHMYRHLV